MSKATNTSCTRTAHTHPTRPTTHPHPKTHTHIRHIELLALLTTLCSIAYRCLCVPHLGADPAIDIHNNDLHIVLLPWRPHKHTQSCIAVVGGACGLGGVAGGGGGVTTTLTEKGGGCVCGGWWGGVGGVDGVGHPLNTPTAPLSTHPQYRPSQHTPQDIHTRISTCCLTHILAIKIIAIPPTPTIHKLLTLPTRHVVKKTIQATPTGARCGAGHAVEGQQGWAQCSAAGD